MGNDSRAVACALVIGLARYAKKLERRKKVSVAELRRMNEIRSIGRALSEKQRIKNQGD